MELETNYLVARRLYRFLPTDENAYIHGGLTPEETLIPSAVYQPVVVSPKPLQLVSQVAIKSMLAQSLTYRLKSQT